MMVAYKKDPAKPYVCTVCGINFAWSVSAWWYGKLDEQPEAVLCSDACKEQHEKQD